MNQSFPATRGPVGSASGIVPQAVPPLISYKSLIPELPTLHPADIGDDLLSALHDAGNALVYAVGKLELNFIDQARADSFTAGYQRWLAGRKPGSGTSLNDFFTDEPWQRQAVSWVVTIDGQPYYAVQPSGPLADAGYDLLQGFYAETEGGPDKPGRDSWISIPGRLRGKIGLVRGVEVPVIEPAVRGVFSWQGFVSGDVTESESTTDLRSFFNAIFDLIRNFGIEPADRATNAVLTDVARFNTIENELGTSYGFQNMNVRQSAVYPEGANAWDITLSFTQLKDPTRMLTFRFTVDVSGEVPVRLGQVNKWLTSI